MSRELRMPSLGADMEAATLVQWKVRPGDAVRKGAVIAVVETEKGLIDVEAFDEGVIERLLVEPGTRVAVGALLLRLAGEAPLAPAGRTRRVSPAARARAARLGVDLARVRGTGPQGVVTLADVDVGTTGAPAPAGAAAAAGGGDARRAMRRAIAASMSRAKREIPHYYLQLALDFTAARQWLETYNAARPVPERLLPAALLIKATARAAAEMPGFNGWYTADGFAPAPAVHAGVAIALRGGGLVAPAILDADTRPLAVVMQELTALVGRVRAGHLRSGEFAAASITINSLGEEGVDTLLPIIHPPQVAIIAFGSVLERAWAVAGRVEARPVMNVALAADHRVSDGRDGARFLARIRDLLADPEGLCS